MYECMNFRKSEESFVTFREYIKLLHDSNEGFEYEILLYYSGTCTSCLCQTSIMNNSFDRFGGFFSIYAMNRGLKNYRA